jgi:hypothetical protein
LHYRFIIEDRGNGIYFTLQDTGLDWEHGIAYSRDGQSLTATDMTLIVVERIIGNWYYYEAK